MNGQTKFVYETLVILIFFLLLGLSFFLSISISLRFHPNYLLLLVIALMLLGYNLQILQGLPLYPSIFLFSQHSPLILPF